ncbi:MULTISPECIES: GNAT family N-acetyltransferase [Gordonia]|uniref:N-acetyltransferase domain-containing protein n=2 Tax=Gordonia TaxID=2053 RepID=L7LD67_9ACTN|nr:MULTISPECIES: GNAT family N-acetyltransferase [Gordonia]AUH67135.1 GNAT family N-acetyltransferase [Gordonia sp. YC-JH1]KJR09048.1 acetyltransferase [Gordonia sihwensis]KXT58494.1 acetyltransferase [Gordonia sp. QH-12]MBY4569106.1 GNAT family N-acetyltransferase [Gordonia sihwensis]WFN93222.1 GNAT family N-acetyltransferase [Gordonia sihwensis]
MTDLDQAATRRDITDALLTAMERRHEVLDAIVDAEDRDAAATAIADLLGKSKLGAEAVLNMSFYQLTKTERRHNQAELDNLNEEITFTLAERPASSGDSLDLRPFSADDDADLFAERTAEQGVAGDGSGAPAGDVADEITKGVDRVDAEDAVWLVAVEGDQKVGIVFGELNDGEVDVRIWIRPESRKRGYGTAALRKSRSEMAALFPGVPMVVRAPSA